MARHARASASLPGPQQSFYGTTGGVGDSELGMDISRDISLPLSLLTHAGRTPGQTFLEVWDEEQRIVQATVSFTDLAAMMLGAESSCGAAASWWGLGLQCLRTILWPTSQCHLVRWHSAVSRSI